MEFIYIFILIMEHDGIHDERSLLLASDFFIEISRSANFSLIKHIAIILSYFSLKHFVGKH